MSDDTTPDPCDGLGRDQPLHPLGSPSLNREGDGSKLRPLAAVDVEESAADMLTRLGDNGMLWAQEFCAAVKTVAGVDLDVGWVFGWFANAIEHSNDVRRWAREKSLAPQNPDGTIPGEESIDVDMVAKQGHQTGSNDMALGQLASQANLPRPPDTGVRQRAMPGVDELDAWTSMHMVPGDVGSPQDAAISEALAFQQEIHDAEIAKARAMIERLSQPIPPHNVVLYLNLPYPFTAGPLSAEEKTVLDSLLYQAVRKALPMAGV